MIGRFKRLKSDLNYLFDRAIDRLNLVIMYFYPLPTWFKQPAASLAYGLGNLLWFLRSFPRQSIYGLDGGERKIAFIGGEGYLDQVNHVFFNGAIRPVEIGRVAFWNQARCVSELLKAGYHLVICESSDSFRFRPMTRVQFSMQPWVQQELHLPEPVSTILEGKRRRGERTDVNRACRAGWRMRFTHAEEDFRYFYQHMYVSFIPSRHGEQAMVTSYQQLHSWFKKGGLLQVECDGQALAGAVLFRGHDYIHTLEAAVLDGNTKLWQQGINSYLYWGGIVYTDSLGLRKIDMGGSHAWTTSGSFHKKAVWGAEVKKRRKVEGRWHFFAEDLPDSLCKQINSIGFIVDLPAGYRQVQMHPSEAEGGEIVRYLSIEAS